MSDLQGNEQELLIENTGPPDVDWVGSDGSQDAVDAPGEADEADNEDEWGAASTSTDQDEGLGHWPVTSNATSSWPSVPYVDDDLGWKDSITSSGRASTPGWPTPEPLAEPDVEPALLDLQALAQDPDAEHLAFANGLQQLNLDTLAEIACQLAPPIDRVPLNDFYVDGQGTGCLADVTNFMSSCHLWHDVALRCGYLWASYASSARSIAQFNVLRARSRGAPMRLRYRDSLDENVLDLELNNASAVYAGGDCSWTDFSSKLAGRIMTNLEILYLKPQETWLYEPLDNPLEMPPQPLHAPRLEICEVVQPIRLDAPALRRLRMKHFTPEQLLVTMAPLLHLERIDIAAPIVQRQNPADWTQLVRATACEQLNFLRIKCRSIDSARLDPQAEPVATPALTLLDVSGPIRLSAPRLAFALICNVHASELLYMLQHMPLVHILYTGWRKHQSMLAPPPQPVPMLALQDIYVSGVMSTEHVTFFRGVRAPAMRKLQMFCDMRGVPDVSVLSESRSRLQSVLSGNADSASLKEFLAEERKTLAQAGWVELTSEVGSMMGGDGQWGYAPSYSQEQWRAAALNLDQGLAAQSALPSTTKPEDRLVELLDAVLTSAELLDIEGDRTDVLVVERGNHILFEAHMKESDLQLLFSVMNPPGHYPFGFSPYEFLDSSAFAVARTFSGLRRLNVERLHIKGDPLTTLSLNAGDGDVRMLRQVLSEFTSVRELRLDFCDKTVWTPGSSTFIALLEDEHVLPELQRLAFLCASPGRDGESLWVQLEHTLRTRRGPLDVALIGECCVEKELVEGFESCGAAIDWQVTCSQGEKWCWICSEGK